MRCKVRAQETQQQSTNLFPLRLKPLKAKVKMRVCCTPCVCVRSVESSRVLAFEWRLEFFAVLPDLRRLNESDLTGGAVNEKLKTEKAIRKTNISKHVHVPKKFDNNARGWRGKLKLLNLFSVS